MTLPQIDSEHTLDFLTTLLNIPSPTGFTDRAIDYIEDALKVFPVLYTYRTRKGALVARWDGEQDDAPRAVTAHTDTLGAMVKEIKSNGRLMLTKIGGFSWITVEGEGCTIFKQDGTTERGALLVINASTHIHGRDIEKTERSDHNMEVRLDAVTTSDTETRELGIEVGDFVAFDPRVEITNGFVRSRHLDDKACVANIFSGIHAMIRAGLRPKQTTYFHISNYEEVGHGASAGIPDSVHELLTLDMAAVGRGQTSNEFQATICVKDSGGPYHYGLNRKLRALADEHAIPYQVDIYPYYGSDGEAFWRAGGDVAVALIGPGVDASHSYERTHLDSINAVTNWLMAFLLSD